MESDGNIRLNGISRIFPRYKEQRTHGHQKPNSISFPKVIDKTYHHKYARTLSLFVENESFNAKSEICPDTRHKE